MKKIVLSKIFSRKFFVWIIATFFCLIKVIDGDKWFWISLIYLGFNVLNNIGTVENKNEKNN